MSKASSLRIGFSFQASISLYVWTDFVNDSTVVSGKKSCIISAISFAECSSTNCSPLYIALVNPSIISEFSSI